MTSLLYQENLLQYAAATLAPVCHQFLIKLEFDLKRKKSINITKVEASVGSQQLLFNQQSGS